MANRRILLKLVVFCISDSRLHVYHENNLLPSKALGTSKVLDKSALDFFGRHFRAKKKDIYVEQLYTVNGEKDSITVVYFVLVSGPTVKKNSGKWMDTAELNSRLKDREIINYAVQRLRWKVEYTNVIYSLLSPEFTLSELQSAYETVLGKKLDKRNFRRKILALRILKNTGKLRKGEAARPAAIYGFNQRKPEFVKILS